MTQARADNPSTQRVGVALVNTPGYQERRDFEDIARRIRSGYPQIDAFVVDNRMPTDADYARVKSRPTLVFSPVGLARFRPDAEKIYQGAPVSKLEQSRLLRAHGVSSPKAAALVAGAYDPQEWGEWVVIKPLSSKKQSKGALFRIQLGHLNRDLAFRKPYLAPFLRDSYAIQEWVDTGPRLAYTRALTLFGEVLYTSNFETEEDFDPAGDDLWSPELVRVNARANVQTTNRTLDVVPDAVTELCRKTYRVFPDRPLLGIDIVVDVQTGEHSVLEINAGGNTWHFSSDHIKKLLGSAQKFKRFRREKMRQLNAFQRAADLIANKAICDLT